MTTREDIIKLAREAGMVVVDDGYSLLPFLERFEALAAAAEREAIIAKLLEIGALEDGEFIAAIRARGQA